MKNKKVHECESKKEKERIRKRQQYGQRLKNASK